MIGFFRGRVAHASLEKDALKVEVDVNGVGYEILMTKSAEPRVPVGQTMTLYVSESVTAFDGATTYYGFPTREEKEFFNRLREHVDGMGPKKALDSMDKISKSLPDFKQAITAGDARQLFSIFGFTKKTAEKLVFSLKGKVDDWKVQGAVKWSDVVATSADSEALSGLIGLGYRDDEAREVLQKVKTKLGANATTETVLQEALKLMGGRK